MPDLSAIKSQLQADGHRTALYASTPVEALVLTVTVTGTVAEPALSVSYSGAIGSYLDVRADMEAEAFRSSVSLGRLRVLSASASVLQIEEVSRGRLTLLPGDVIRVYRSWRLRDRLVAANASFDKDSRVTYAAQTDLYAPVVAGGGPWAGFVDATTALVTVPFNGAASYMVDPDSSGARTYSWDIADGTATIGTVTSASLTCTFPAGFRWVSLTVTDSSNSKASTQRIPVWAHTRTGSGAPMELVRADLTTSLETAWTADFEIAAGTTTATLPDGSLIVLWTEDLYAGTVAAYGSGAVGRSHMRFTGYLVQDSSDSDGEQGEGHTQFQAVSPVGLLARLPGFSQVVEQVSTPANWQQASDLTANGLIDYLLRWHTTLHVLHDFTTTAFGYPYPTFFLQAQTPDAQVREIADAVDCILVSDKNGRVAVRAILSLVDVTQRGLVDTVLTLTDDDVLRVRYGRAHRARFGQLEARGVKYNGGAAASGLISRAPGNAPAEAADNTVADRLITSDQGDLNRRAGWRYARENNSRYGLPVLDELEVTLRASFDVFDVFAAEWVVLNLPAAYSRRGIAVSGRCEVTGIRTAYDGEAGTRVVTLTLRQETDGEPGVTYTPPPTDAGFIEVPPLDLVPSGIATGDVPMVLPWDGITRYPVRMRGLGTNGALFRSTTYDAEANALAMEDVTGSVTGLGIWMVGDPYAPNTAFALTADGLWKCADFNAVTPSWTMVCAMTAITGSASTALGTRVVMSINRKGWMCVTGAQNVVSISTNYGAAWTRYTVTGSPLWADTATGLYNTTGIHSYQTMGIAVSPHNSAGEGHIYVSTGGEGNCRIYKSTNWGVTWTYLAGPFASAGALNVPYQRTAGVANKNGASQWVYAAAFSWAGAHGGNPNYASKNGGSTWVTNGQGGTAGKDGMHSFTFDGNRIAWGRTANGYSGVEASVDGGVTTMLSPNFTGNHDAIINIHGHATAPNFLLAFMPYSVYGVSLAWTTDFGVTFIVPTLPAFLTASSGFIAYAEVY